MEYSLSSHIVYRLVALIAALPLSWLRAFACWRADRSVAANDVLTRTTRRNFELVQPNLDLSTREKIVAQTMRCSAMTFVESLAVWTRSRQRNLRLITEVHGLVHLERAASGGDGVIVIAPHYGNWELLVQFLAARGPFSLIYRPGKRAAIDGFLKLARQRHDVQVIPAENHALRPLLAALKRGETVGITPDQLPNRGGGEHAPFFAHAALTMTLISRLLTKTGCGAVFAVAERLADGNFRIVIEPASAQIASTDIVSALTALNHGVEHIALRDMTQYQWTYKRFRDGPLGPGNDNPYWPDCYDHLQ